MSWRAGLPKAWDMERAFRGCRSCGLPRMRRGVRLAPFVNDHPATRSTPLHVSSPTVYQPCSALSSPVQRQTDMLVQHRKATTGMRSWGENEKERERKNDK